MTTDTSHGERTGVLLLFVVGFLLLLLLCASVASFAAWKIYQGVFVATETPSQSTVEPLVAKELDAEVRTDHEVAAETNATITPKATEPESDPPVQIDRGNNLGDNPTRDEETPVRLVADLPSLGPEVPKSLGPTEPSIKYAWESVKQLVYEFEIEAELGPRKIKYRGRNTIQGTGKRPTELTMDGQTDEGTGSGFVIHPQGIVVTCAHVVKGATRIQALIGESEFSATVIKLDFENDLAVLCLEKGGLPYLQLADSDHVRLGQEVRAIGYPLSDVLGESIKVTKGEVSGRGNGQDGIDGLQIDATINPGNSGGPLVDDAGRLVGVTSSLLAGAGISEVGFAIPANKVIELAKELGVPVEVDDQATAMSAAVIIDRVSPATVLLKVTVGPSGVGMALPHLLEYSGYVVESSSPTAGNFPTGLPRDENFSGKFQVDASGELFSDDTQGMMPLMLGGASQIGIEVLPDSAPGRTVSRHLVMIPRRETRQRGSELDPYGFGSFAPRRRPPWMQQQTTLPKTSNLMLGIESTTITLGKRLADGIELEKSYSLSVEGESKDDQPLSVTGLGKGRFDPQAGRMLNMNYKVTITVSQDNITAKIPITMNYRLVDDAELEKERQARQEREQTRMREKANQLKSSGFDSPQETPSAAKDEIEFESVKAVPESTHLNKFDPDK